MEPPVAVEEEKQSEGNEHDTAHDLDDHVAVAEPSERAHRAGERHAGEEEGTGQAQRVRGEEHGSLQHRPRVAREDEYRREHRPDARCGTNGERAAEKRTGSAAACAGE